MVKRKNLKTWLIISVLLASIQCTIAAGEVIYVDDDASVGGNGQTWGTAYKYLQDALAEATSGDEIWVAEGTYKPDEDTDHSDGTGDRGATFQLINGVALYGGFSSGGGAWNDRNPNAYVTILSGDLAGDDGPNFANNGENSYHVVTGSGTDANAVLDGFTVTAGNADGSPWPHYAGGGMCNSNSSPTVTGCTFTGNSADYGGGMLNYDSSSPTVTGCTFTGNSAYEGGGMFNYPDSSPTVTGCTFTGNSAKYGYGGGMYNESSSPTVTDCTFSGNSTDRGGGMANFDSSSPVVTNCTFSGNKAEFNVGGGGMCNHSSSPTVINCTFSSNLAVRGGGMSNWSSSSPTVTNCKFYGNTAGDGGGGMYNRDFSLPTVTNCTFSGNSTLKDGGGMHNMISSSPTLTNCTFSGNEAGTAPGYSGHGGGMYNWSSSSPTVTNCTFSQNSAGAWEGGSGMYNSSCSPTVTNCIFWSNLPSEIRNNNAYASLTYCDVLGGYAGEGNIDTDPLFMDADGPDDTVGTADDNLRLSAGSPCIDAADNTAVPSGVTTDLDGNPRFVDDPDTINTGNGTAPIVDMGAYEFGAWINDTPVYRFWSPVNERHFYTISESEKDKLIDIYAHVWTYETIAYYAFAEDSVPGLVPVYRFWSPVLVAHFYTISESEKQKLIDIYPHVWTYEGIAFYAYPEGQQPGDAEEVYRFWSPVLETHFYTMNETEKNKLIDNYSHVWTYESIAWYAYE